jgi:hypothetical protein
MTEIEQTIAQFAQVRRHALDFKLPPIAAPRALLRACLAELAAGPSVSSWRQFFQFISTSRAAAYLCLALLAGAVVGQLFLRYTSLRKPNPSVLSLDRALVPDRNLTPGATRRVSVADVCSMAHEEVVREVPTGLRQQILHEYGIADPHAADYEIDFLIAPGLGGTEDIHNLWPEPYTSPIWNAHVKDALEERLHQLVCAGQLDLSAAQNDIANDWITAYKKYFHTDMPIAPRSGLRDSLDQKVRETWVQFVLPTTRRLGGQRLPT